MKKQLLSTLVCLIALFGFQTLAAQGDLSPIAKRVEAAKATKHTVATAPLFAPTASSNLSAVAGVAEALHGGLVLDWDATRIAQAKNSSADYLQVQLPVSETKTLTLELFKADFMTPEFRVINSAQPNRPITDIDGTHYWGVVKGRPNTLAAISIYENEVIGIINVGNDRWVLGAIEGDAEKRHILYNNADLRELPAFECMTDEAEHRIGTSAPHGDVEKDASNCVKMYVETDYDLFVNKGSVANVTNYMTGVFSQVALLYANDNINFMINELFVWSTTDPYTGTTTSNYLTQFRNAKNGVYNGDLAHLVGIAGSGGVAYLDVLCEGYYGVGYSGIQASYSNVPTYSWTVEVLTHEIGHNLGSSHTHGCVWNGNNTAIDGCGPAAGYSEGCTAALPAKGTIMSYCHLVSGVGIDFNLGFGPQPGDLIRNRVYNAPCLTSCGGGGGGGGGTCSDNEVTISILLDNYPGETTWRITNAGGTVVASGGPYSAGGTTVTATACLPDGCYDFTILDSYGDGICCSYGNGAYSVTDVDGNTLASGGSFAASETTNFCVPDGGGGGGGGCTYSTINTANFDGGFGIWTDGGTDCARVNSATYASSGTYSIRLRDNTNTSVMSTTNQNLSAYSELTFTFSFVTVSFENNEDFWVQLSTNGGSTYATVATFVAGSGFANSTRYNATVTIPGPFTSTTRLRIRADASADDDQLYIDDAVITGCSGGALIGNSVVLEENAVSTIGLYPNPATDFVTATFMMGKAQTANLVVTDFTGRTLWQDRQYYDAGPQQVNIDLSDMVSGVYYLTITLADGTRTTQKFVKVR